MPEIPAAPYGNIDVTLGQIVAASTRPKQHDLFGIAFLSEGNNLPVHSVERRHLQNLQLNVEVDFGDGG